MSPSSRHGFTLIELTVVLALIGVIAAFGVAMSYSSLSKTSIAQERDLFVTLLLRSTRAAAIANKQEVSHGVYIDNDTKQYVLFAGDTYNASDTSNRSVPFTNDAITVSNTGGDTIVFEQLSDSVSTGAGTIRIESADVSQNIIIRETGQIDW